MNSDNERCFCRFISPSAHRLQYFLFLANYVFSLKSLESTVFFVFFWYLCVHCDGAYFSMFSKLRYLKT